MQFKFEVEGREYEWDARFTIKEAFFLKEKCYLTVPQFGPAIAQSDPHALAGLIYLAKRRNGEVVKWEDLGDIDLLTFNILEVPEVEEPGKPEEPEEAEPTKSAGKSSGKTRKSDTSST